MMRLSWGVFFICLFLKYFASFLFLMPNKKKSHFSVVTSLNMFTAVTRFQLNRQCFVTVFSKVYRGKKNLKMQFELYCRLKQSHAEPTKGPHLCLMLAIIFSGRKSTMLSFVCLCRSCLRLLDVSQNTQTSQICKQQTPQRMSTGTRDNPQHPTVVYLER